MPHWFALGADRQPFAFAGIWRPWTGTRKGEEGEHRLFAFLITEPNDVVRPVQGKAMPVILTEENWNTWLTADAVTALTLQQPVPAERLVVVASGQQQGAAAQSVAGGASASYRLHTDQHHICQR